jgi:hypothetical protein
MVRWSLEKPCVFRSGENCFLPTETESQLDDLRHIAEAENCGRIQHGICIVTLNSRRSTNDASEEKAIDESRSMPCMGFRIAERIGRYGTFAFRAAI